jgi:hypothetical protein
MGAKAVDKLPHQSPPSAELEYARRDIARRNPPWYYGLFWSSAEGMLVAGIGIIWCWLGHVILGNFIAIFIAAPTAFVIGVLWSYFRNSFKPFVVMTLITICAVIYYFIHITDGIRT